MHQTTVAEPTAMDVAGATSVASLLADPLRMRILLTLEDRDLTVSELTARLGVAQPRVSTHLGILRDAGWVKPLPDGRQTPYRLTAASAPETIRTLLKTGDATNAAISARRSRSTRRPGESDPMRHARTCYDHLAGEAGVLVCGALLERGWITPVHDLAGKFQPAYELTETGREELERRGVTVPDSPGGQRRFAYACPDWTEPHPHIAGALGAAILDNLVERDFVRRLPGTRTVRVERPIEDWLG